MADRIPAFLKMLERGQDSALLRFSLGTEYLAAGDPESAAEHLQQAVAQDPAYSAAWKLLGKSLASSGELQAAADAYSRGIEAAEQKGDRQAAREMRVFRKRAMKALDEEA